MPKHCLSFTYISFFLLSLKPVSAQDSALIPSSSANAIAFYNNYIGENSHLYNGTEYVAYDFRIKGNQYFLTNILQNGVINYDEVLYSKVNLAYDIVRVEVTTNRYSENFRIKLISEKISYFILQNHFFIRLMQDSSNKSIINTGFYDQLYKGNMTLLAKRQKKVKEKVTAEDGDQLWFEENDQFILIKNNRYYSVQSKSLLFDVFKERKKELKKYLKKNKLKFKKDPENTIIKAVEFCDQLKK